MLMPSKINFYRPTYKKFKFDEHLTAQTVYLQIQQGYKIAYRNYQYQTM
jgi:hypothetical protein